MNVTIEDIKEVAEGMKTRITDATAQTILNEFNRVVMDRADDWETIIKELINNK